MQAAPVARYRRFGFGIKPGSSSPFREGHILRPVKKYSEIRGEPIGIGSIVVVRVPVRVDIAEVRRVVVIS